MLAADTPGETRIYTTDAATAERRTALEQAGATVVTLKTTCGQVDPAAVLTDLGELGVNDLLIEGGSAVHGAFFDAGLVDRVQIYVAPLLVGGSSSPGPIGGAGVATLPEAWRLSNLTTRQTWPDLVIEADVERPAGDGHV
jgi:diaminohydroxyphosphoribosylaminopyrimidine deaminase/5-amino-6-(5-phosphoribosylamino)uracil reductase